jgi:hypothetical protein
MDPGTTRTIGKVFGGCGCLTLGAMGLWLIFVIIIGIQGRGNDAEASLVIGSVTCGLALPVLLVTAIGWFLGLRKGD